MQICQFRFLFKCSSLIASKHFLKDGVRSSEARSEWVFLNVLSEDHNSHPSFPGVSQGLSRPILENTKPTNLQWEAAKQENKILALKIDSTCNWEKKTLSFNKILGLNESQQLSDELTYRQTSHVSFDWSQKVFFMCVFLVVMMEFFRTRKWLFDVCTFCAPGASNLRGNKSWTWWRQELPSYNTIHSQI